MTVAVDSPSLAFGMEYLVRRAGALYTLPAAAAEVLRLTQEPKVDVAALKDCIANDPALTVKILRVVNSSFFGLSREVRDLNQAIALLGIKPLKLLVLGFSLPENLFLATSRDQLDRYWNITLARAVAAREISEQVLRVPGDDAFLAGLLQDLGVLVLLAELGQPYAEMLAEANAAHVDVCQLETAALGFDHAQLTAALLDHWNMPKFLVQTVAAPRIASHWAKNRADHAPLVRTLHVADLLAQLVGLHRLNVLPDLLETGAEYYEWDATKLKQIVALLEPKVRLLAGLLSLDASQADQYMHTLAQAHQEMARVAESIAGELTDSPPRHRIAKGARTGPSAGCSLAEIQRLQAAFDRYAGQTSVKSPTCDRPVAITSNQPRVENHDAPSSMTLQFDHAQSDDFLVRLTMAVGESRSRKCSLGVLSLGVTPLAEVDSAQKAAIEQLLDATCVATELHYETLHSPLRGRRTIILAGRDRTQSVAIARAVVERLNAAVRRLRELGDLPACRVGAGVASVASPAKNFLALKLVETAENCLGAALRTGGVKSLEVS